MKKTLALLLLVFLVSVSLAQIKTDSSKHLAFKGIPIDGTLNEYVSKMKQSGFSQVKMEDDMAILQGDFAGYKDCSVIVSTLKQKDLVYKIGVVFPKRDTWSMLSENYFDLKQMLTEKYGKPSEIAERFDSNLQPRDDGDKMHEVQFDRCKFYSIWQTDKGEIQLSIDHKGVLSCFVKLAYFDKSNGAAIKKQALDDL